MFNIEDIVNFEDDDGYIRFGKIFKIIGNLFFLSTPDYRFYKVTENHIKNKTILNVFDINYEIDKLLYLYEKEENLKNKLNNKKKNNINKFIRRILLCIHLKL